VRIFAGSTALERPLAAARGRAASVRQRRSTIPAIAWPKPMHIVAMP
jgi:hypothetical protein